ncbi:MAG: membrane protein [Gammaproteobacteria bacterium]|nr:MAG: membrane protein [Gammaproteobacteria bacterium]
MKLLAVVLALLSERLLGQLRWWNRLDLPALWHRLLAPWLPAGGVRAHWLAPLLLWGPPVLLTAALDLALAGVWFELPRLLLALGVLAACLGPEAFNVRVDAFLAAAERGDEAAARRAAAALLGDEAPAGLLRQAQAVAAALLYEGHVRLFAVLFWFFLLGPAGALLYRLASDTARRGHGLPAALHAHLRRLFAWLDAVPAHLFALGFFLAGSFDDAWHAWRRVWATELGLAERNRTLVVVTGCGALRHDLGRDLDDHGEALRWVRAARALVLRAVVVWVGVAALMTLSGTLA